MEPARTPRRLARVAIGATIIVAVAGVTIPAVALAGPSTASGETVLAATEASWTTARQPTVSQGSKPYLSASRAEDATYLKFDGSSLIGGSVTSARLEMRVASTTATRPGLEVFPSATDWSEETLTHLARPSHVDALLSAGSVKAAVGTVSIPLSLPLVIAADGTVGFEIRYSEPYVSTTFYGIGGRSAPKLHVSTSPVDPTGTLAPSPSGSPSPSATPTLTPSPTPSATPTPTPTPTPTVGPTPPPTGSTSDLAFAVAPSNASEKKVFAHYFPPYPVSLDNKDPSVDYYTRNYLNPQGEGSKFASSGGLLRDRPLGRAPLNADWQVKDMRSEVVAASDAGIDGFTIDIMSVSGANWDRTLDLIEGTETAGRNFTLVPNLDLTASLKDVSVPSIASKLAEFYSSPAAYRLASGEYALSSFAAERKSTAWWSELKSTLESKYGIRTALIAVFLDANDNNLSSFAPISYALSNWGVRSPTSIKRAPDYAAKAHALGVKWMSPVAVQDVRPRSFKYDEAGNTETLRASWDRAISADAELVQLVTWNDYSESTSFAPSSAHGESFLDVNAYYQSWFKSGAAPSITGDAVYLTHRVQFAGTSPSLTQRLMLPTLSGTSMQPRDTVEVLTFLTDPATVTVRVGGKPTTFEAPAGVFTKTVPLALGEISVNAARSGTDFASAVSPFPVLAKPRVQDLQYYATSSRQG